MVLMDTPRTIAQWLSERGMDLAQLVESSRLDARVVEAIVACRYTTSPAQRERLARALGVPVHDIQWGGAVGVDHMYGHGPQFGRSP
jgi:hypothetical protein